MTHIYADTSNIIANTDIIAAHVKDPIDALDTALNNLVTGADPVSGIDIDGGSIDGTIIGAASAAALTATTLTATQTLSLDRAGDAADIGLVLNKDAGRAAVVSFRSGGNERWTVGQSSGGGFIVNRFAADASYQSTPIFINDATGGITFDADVEINGALNHDGSTVGFFNIAPATRQTITGSRGGNAALASLLTALAAYGLIIDSSS